MKRVLLFIALVPACFGFNRVPEKLSAGDFSVTLKTDDTWSAEVFDKKGRIVYRTVDRDAAIELSVIRIVLPADAALADGSEIAKSIVWKDAFKFKKAIFNHAFSLPPKATIVKCPLGTAYVYAPEQPVFIDPTPHFARVALVLPSHYKASLVAYLVVGHQAGSYSIDPEQNEYFDAIVQGVQDSKDNKSLEVTLGSATPAANAPVAPPPGVSHF